MLSSEPIVVAWSNNMQFTHFMHGLPDAALFSMIYKGYQG